MTKKIAPLAAAGLAALSALATAGAHQIPARPRPRVLRSNTLAPQMMADAKSLEADPPPTEPSAAPSPDDWRPAPQVPLAHGVAACSAFRVREWLKIHCGGFPAAGVSLLAGQREGVALWVDPPREANEPMKTLRTAEVVFPMRPGDGRIFQIGQFGEGWDGPVSWNLAYTISEQWVAGEPAPIVTIR